MSRTIIIGDIHGCYDELIELVEEAKISDGDLVVSVGDLVDRGPKPVEVVAWLRARPKSVVLMGNHERKHVRQVFSYSQEITRVQFGEAYGEAVEWMRGLPYYYETADVRVVHAAMMPGVPLAEQDEQVLCGSTAGEKKLRDAIPDAWWHEKYDERPPVVFGHHVTGPEPLIRDGMVYGIDTGACHGQRLTALSVPDFQIYSVPAHDDHWRTVTRTYQVPVLRTRPWPTMSWAKLAAGIDERRRDGDATDATAYLDALAAWADAIRALIPTLRAHVAAIADRLRAEHGADGFTAAAEQHALKRLLHVHARGRLDDAAIAARCGTPELTLKLAAEAGADTSALPALP